jgi:hypothetical protein
VVGRSEERNSAKEVLNDRAIDQQTETRNKVRRKKSEQRLLADIFEGVDRAEWKKNKAALEGVPRAWIDKYVEHLQKIIDKQNEELKKLREENNKILDAITVDKKMRDHMIAGLNKPD